MAAEKTWSYACPNIQDVRSHSAAFPRGSVVALCCPTRRPLCVAEVLAPSATKTFSVSVQQPMRRQPEQYSRQHVKVSSLTTSFAVYQCRAVFQKSAPRTQRVVATTQQIIFGNEPAWLDTRVCVTCFAILWLALKGEGVSSSVATTLDAAAGLAQRQKWGLILPSSARVSKLTYQTVIGVRYPELVAIWKICLH